jgi:hypothetical protein
VYADGCDLEAAAPAEVEVLSAAVDIASATYHARSTRQGSLQYFQSWKKAGPAIDNALPIAR